MNNLRPDLLDNFIGQKNTISRLQILIHAAKKDNQPLPHILFDGPPGLRKTTLATALAHEMGVSIQIANGGSVRTIKTLLPYLMNLSLGSILFVDEIHRLTAITSEMLYPAMEDWRIDVGREDEPLSIDLPQFTLIGATTESGSLPPPLRDRFNQKFHLKVYNNDDLSILIKNNAYKLNMFVTPKVCQLIAQRARGTPRIANNLLVWIKK